MKLNQSKFLAFEKMIKEANDAESLAQAYLDYRHYMIKVDPIKALSIIEEGCKAIAKYDNEDLKIKMSSTRASTLMLMERYKEAFEAFLTGYHQCTTSSNKENMAAILGNMAGIFFRFELFKYANYLWKMMLKKYINPQNTYETNFVINNLMLLNYAYLQNEIYGLDVIEDMILYYKKLENPMLRDYTLYINAVNNKARYYKLKQNYQKAIETLEELIELCETHQFETKKIDIYYELGVLYRKIDQEEQMVASFKKMLLLGEQYNIRFTFSGAYYEMYEYYKSKNKHSQALGCFEKHTKYRQTIDEMKKNIDDIAKDFVLAIPDSNKNLIVKLIEDFTKLEEFLFIETTHEEIVKIQLEDILYACTEDSLVRIHLANHDTILANMTYSKFLKLLNSFDNYSKLIFETNSKGTLVNLFWLTRVDFNSKTLFIRPFYKEIEIPISKRQSIELKKLLSV